MIGVPAHLAGVAAELDEVAAGAIGFDAGFGVRHLGFRSW
jgi:hypothetical protein